MRISLNKPRFCADLFRFFSLGLTGMDNSHLMLGLNDWRAEFRSVISRYPTTSSLWPKTKAAHKALLFRRTKLALLVIILSDRLVSLHEVFCSLDKSFYCPLMLCRLTRCTHDLGFGYSYSPTGSQNERQLNCFHFTMFLQTAESPITGINTFLLDERFFLYAV